ncbi:MAG TPA: cardiolipin synthase ClsB [Woeseiaceae bacterium]|nr:cardiolipin synthase ClsB [Woeseiaceae bacterium]
MSDWTSGNELRLLENGEELYPRIFDAIAGAREEVVLETFIWMEDGVGRQLRDVLVEAAERGVQVRALVDGYGSAAFSAAFLESLDAAGVRLDAFDPQPKFLRMRTNLLCRMHRKIVIIDGERAFVGGINFADEHLRSFGERSKQDYAVEVTGPVVQDIHAYCRYHQDVHSGPPWKRWRHWLRRFPREMINPREGAQALFVFRDNGRHPTDIETLYRAGIRGARQRIVIANAYFFPGYRLVRDLRRAAKRGVEVSLIMQGKPDRPVSVWAASILYNDLLSMGVRIFLYTERALHGKVAAIDDRWATVGSSNLDPFSLGLNLEANLFVLDEGFNAELQRNLDGLVDDACTELKPAGRPRQSALRRLILTGAYHVMRRMPGWGSHLPYHEQHIQPIKPPAV